MTHLIVLQNNQTFYYRVFENKAEEVQAEILRGGDRLAFYGIVSLSDMGYTAHRWRDWVIALPVDEKVNSNTPSHAFQHLTRRQLDVLLCLAEGMTGKQIAGKLKIHTRSVSLHISALKRNLSANTTAECVQKAARLGILKPGR